LTDLAQFSALAVLIIICFGLFAFMFRRLVIAGVAALAICIALPAGAWTNNDPIKWAWTCKSSGFYTIEAFPDGSYKPAVDYTGNRQVVINIREASQQIAKDACNVPYFYYAEMQGEELATNYNNKVDICDKVTSRFESLTLNEVSGSSGGLSFIVSRDDNDWRFVISGTDLTTEREGRKLRILSPSPYLNFKAQADVWMITGQCIMTTK
jgi:hypothetical protein